MKRKLMFLALAAMGLASCNGGFKKAPGGLLYDIVVDKAGPSIQPGDFVSLNITLKNDADSVLFSTYDQGSPFMRVMQKPQQASDVFSGFLYLSEGDSAVIKTNIDSLYKAGARPAGLKGKYQIFTVKVEKVIQKGHLDEKVFEGRVQDFYSKTMDAIKKKAQAAEPGKIKKYIADNNLKVTTTADGLNYQVTKMGTGEKPANGDTVAVYYVGKFVDGKVFDTNIKEEAKKANIPVNPMSPYKPIRFPLGVQGMIKGWNEVLALLPNGSKATFVLPSSLGYGDNGYQRIGPFTPLVFEIELVDVVHPNPNAPKPTVPAMPGQPTQATPAPVKK
ncbi:MAG TPA: FKBP-type peptidyl-prolyl cis-trans isomerase [Mucilaginibacter sp.]|jgi:FKBP-type peptidyl-prolyl cis-trans isomerase|nr:FKBP-type peptidyl-prolyl cis-trans isomerase [Mucilaginibacter sp.]